MKDTESLHTDQHDANVISPVVNSSDEAGQENDKAGDNSYDEPAKRVSENLETSSASKQDKRHKSRKRKRNPISSKRYEGSQNQSVKIGKDIPFLILVSYIQIIIQLIY